ncbi:MAG: hypothetical protein K9K40_03060 [Desulfotignum sp.]|nr:hypothetical protein [Desulfotignum sp.]
MGRISLAHGKEKLIVIPLLTDGDTFVKNRTGLGIHFFLGNLFCLHPGLAECWFGWRVKQIFSDPADLTAYCRGTSRSVDIMALGKQQKVRFWLQGKCVISPEQATVQLKLHDTADTGRVYDRKLALTFDDGQIRFRQDLFDWLGHTGLGFPVLDHALWPERITRQGFETMGKALEILYLNYVAGVDRPIDLTEFDHLAHTCPDSYLALDLKGWVLCKNKKYRAAIPVFLRALDLNPSGFGALAGLMWCGVHTGDRKMALTYALAKLACHGDPPEKARSFVEKKFA